MLLAAKQEIKNRKSKEEHVRIPSDVTVNENTARTFTSKELVDLLKARESKFMKSFLQHIRHITQVIIWIFNL